MTSNLMRLTKAELVDMVNDLEAALESARHASGDVERSVSDWVSGVDLSPQDAVVVASALKLARLLDGFVEPDSQSAAVAKQLLSMCDQLGNSIGASQRAPLFAVPAG